MTASEFSDRKTKRKENSELPEHPATIAQKICTNGKLLKFQTHENLRQRNSQMEKEVYGKLTYFTDYQSFSSAAYL
jgi:hypothetical protein